MGAAVMLTCSRKPQISDTLGSLVHMHINLATVRAWCIRLLGVNVTVRKVEPTFCKHVRMCVTFGWRVVNSWVIPARQGESGNLLSYA